MDKFTPEQPIVFDSPEAEIAHLKNEVKRHIEAEKAEGREAAPAQVGAEVIKAYANTAPEKVLAPNRQISQTEAEAITLDLAPEAHDKQIEHLLGVMESRGLKNALSVLAKMGNPHLEDDFHRFLIQYISTGHKANDLKESSPMWKPLHMALFEVSLPESFNEDKGKRLKELISSMEQFYAGMLSGQSSLSNENNFSIEIANANGSDQFVFYVSVPTNKKILLEKQIIAIFPGARIEEHKNDYNIFNPDGVTVGSVAKLANNFLYPLKFYEEFDFDPLSTILNSFSKIDRDGEGAAIQFIFGGRQDELVKKSQKAIEKIRKGAKISEALKEMKQTFGTVVAKEFLSFFKSNESKEKEKQEKTKLAGAVDQVAIEQFVKKLKSPLVGVNLRLIVSSKSEAEADAIIEDIESSFNQFENGYGNRLNWNRYKKGDLKKVLRNFSFRIFNEDEQFVINLSEATTLIHFPATSEGKAAPQLKQNKAGTASPPLDLPTSGTLIGINRHRGEETSVYVGAEDRMRHFYVIGQTGTGKTTLLKNMIVQDIKDGSGVCFIDPHGSDVQDILANIPQERFKDVIYFDPADTTRAMALNMLEFDHNFPEQKTFVVNEMFSIFQKLYGAVPESMGPMFEQYFRNATMLVIEDPESGSTLLDVSRVMANKAFRDLKISRCKNPIVVQFWKEIAEKAGGEASLANIVPYITSKFDVFLANEIMRPIISQEKSSFNLREIMDSKKILLVNLSKGRLGDINSHLIGLILVGKILMAALSRVDNLGSRMSDFFLYLDEFQNITTDSIATILSEARKYRLSLTIAHQFIGQVEEKIKNAVFGNVGSMAVFRVGIEDAEFLERQFTPIFTKNDIINLDNRHAYLRLLSNGRPVKPFNVETLPPSKGNFEQVAKLREVSLITFGRPRSEVEEEVMEKYKNK